MLTNGNALAAIACYAAELPIAERQTVLQNIPLFFNPGGPAGLHPALAKGGRTVALPGLRAGHLPRRRAALPGEPHHPCPDDDPHGARPPGAGDGRPLHACGASRAAAHRCRRSCCSTPVPVFGDVFCPTYGMAETYSCGLVLRPENQRPEGDDDDIRRLGSAGKPHLLVDVAVVAEDGQPVPRDGHHARRGARARRRRRAAATSAWPRRRRESFAGGWMHTGDLATVDGDGFITIVDRMKDIIISGGINVAQPRGRRGAPAAP